MKKYLKLIRIKHWLKNLLVFLPLFFSLKITNYVSLIIVLLGFVSFSIVSSIVYIFNDINDLEVDKLHPIKKNRPLASGAISVKRAYSIIVLLFIIFIMNSTILFIRCDSVFVFLIPIIYIVLNLFYSKILKKIPIIDVCVIVIGFLLRVMFGGLILNINVSKWLYLMIIFGSFYLGFGKRRNEIIKNGEKSRNVLKYYNKDFLDKNMYVALTLAMVSYSLWTVDLTTVVKSCGDYIFWTIPLVLIIFQLYSLNIEGNSHGDPIEVILSDKILLSIIIFYMIILVLLFYIL